MNDTADVQIDLRYFLNLLLERLWLIVLCLFVFLLAGLSYISLAPKLYQSTAVLEVPQQAQRVTMIEDVSSQDFTSREVLKTIEENLKQRGLYERVMAREDVAAQPDKLFAGLDKDIKEAPVQTKALLLKKWTDVQSVRGTRIIEVSVEHRIPEMAQRLANAIVEEYTRRIIGSQTGSSQAAFDMLLEEADRIQQKLQKSEEALQDFQKAVELREKIVEQEDVVNELLGRYRDKHPSLIQARALLDRLQKQFQNELLTVAEKLQNAENARFWKEKGEELKGLSGQALIDAQLKLMEARFNVLTREVETDRILYDSIVTRMKETNVTRGIETSSIKLVEKGHLPLKPSKPRKLLILAAALFCGLGAGFGCVILINLLDNTIKTVDQAEELTGLSVLAAVSDDNRLPDVDWMKSHGKRILDELKERAARGDIDTTRPTGKSEKNSKKKIQPLVLVSEPGGQMAESIRSLRASVKLLGKEEDKKVLLITSGVPGEGKSFISSNLALAFSQEGRKTLLIDADLRRPMVDKIFNLDDQPQQKGLSNLLTSDVKPESQIIPSGFANLDIIPVGPKAPNPAEILASPSFGDLIRQLSSRYDRIIVDSAPVNSVSDSMLILEAMQGVILIAHAAKTPRGAVLRAIHQLKKGGKSPLGLVLNRMPSRSGLLSDPYYYYYSAGDGYGEAYGEKDSS